jgi:hypothetical protein
LCKCGPRAQAPRQRSCSVTPSECHPIVVRSAGNAAAPQRHQYSCMFPSTTMRLYCSTTLAQAAIRGSDSRESAVADVWSDYVEARHQLSGMATAAVIDSSTAYEPRGIFEVIRNNEAVAETQQQYKDQRVQRPAREHHGAASRKTATDTDTETTGRDVNVHEGHTTRATWGYWCINLGPNRCSHGPPARLR